MKLKYPEFRKILFIVTVLWVGGFVVQGQDIKSTDEIIAKVDSMIPALQVKFNVPGVSYVILRDYEMVYSRGFGVKDVRTNEPVTDETMFEACSMTKPVFAYLAMKQVESGSLKLDSPVWTIYDDPAFQGQELRKKITARMLLSHTSGLPNWRPGEDEENGYLPIEFEPGTKFSYSGEGMYYLQKVVEKITGKSLEVLAKETLFERNLMKNSSFVYSPEFEERLAAGHDTLGKFQQKNFLFKSKCRLFTLLFGNRLCFVFARCHGSRPSRWGCPVNRIYRSDAHATNKSYYPGPPDSTRKIKRN
jgi:CubicO group peptidase (beta-lactamase class C family)